MHCPVNAISVFSFMIIFTPGNVPYDMFVDAVDIQTLRAPIIYCSRCISISNIIENPITHLANGYTYINHAYREKICIFFAFLRHLHARSCARQYWYRLKARLRTSEACAKDELADRLLILNHPIIDNTTAHNILLSKLDFWKFQ